VVREFQKETEPIADPLFIIQAFEEVRARPLDNFEMKSPMFDNSVLPGNRYGLVPVDHGESENDAMDGADEDYENPETEKETTPRSLLSEALNSVEARCSYHEFKMGLQELQEKLGFPVKINGFTVGLWASHGRAREWMMKTRQEEEKENKEDKDGLVFAALLGEINVFFQ
jgi:hypothetical protein